MSFRVAGQCRKLERPPRTVLTQGTRSAIPLARPNHLLRRHLPEWQLSVSPAKPGDSPRFVGESSAGYPVVLPDPPPRSRPAVELSRDGLCQRLSNHRNVALGGRPHDLRVDGPVLMGHLVAHAGQAGPLDRRYVRGDRRISRDDGLCRFSNDDDLLDDGLTHRRVVVEHCAPAGYITCDGIGGGHHVPDAVERRPTTPRHSRPGAAR